MQEHILYMLAQGESPSMLTMLVPMALFIGIMYFMLIRPQQRQKREHEDMVKKIKAGDRVKTAGGIHGTVASVKDQTFILEVAEKVKIEIDRGSVIHRVNDAADEKN